jgi:hypothetical protein
VWTAILASAAAAGFGAWRAAAFQPSGITPKSSAFAELPNPTPVEPAATSQPGAAPAPAPAVIPSIETEP